MKSILIAIPYFLGLSVFICDLNIWLFDCSGIPPFRLFVSFVVYWLCWFGLGKE